jgi:glucose/arabinose dehydrogenase/mono/diheme cytochrome c family protein
MRRMHSSTRRSLAAALLCLISIFLFAAMGSTANKDAAPACSEGAGLKLPSGFCATVFAEGIGHARHLVVGSNGIVYVNTWSGDYYDFDKVHEGGFLVALEDKSKQGKADVIERFGENQKSGAAGGTGIGIYKGAIYAEVNDRIVRYALPQDGSVPQAAAETVVSGLPLGGDHPMHPFIIGKDGSLYIDVASATNSCQPQNRQPKVPGANPCTELETRAGIWRYDANKSNQKFSPADRFATGIRNGEGFAFDAQGHLLVTQHGRDQLHSNWPELYQAGEEATLPAEEVLLLKSGGDYGWPECYYDGGRKQLVLAPEYGGDGGKSVGICRDKLGPAAAFPAHWAPNAMVHYDQKQFPARYREGVFIAFHGSWNRAPYAQGGYNVVFQPLRGGQAADTCEIFADGFAGPVKTPEGAEHRPAGLAVGPDGALYVSDDIRGRIYRITYTGDPAGPPPTATPCPSNSASAGQVVEAESAPPESNTADLPVPDGSSPDMIALGYRIYQGQVAGATCTGCHGTKATGTPLGPDLTKSTWMWSDGSLAGILKVITEGVPRPKQFRSPMPPMGGAELSDTQAKAVAAYVWALSHKGK